MQPSLSTSSEISKNYWTGATVVEVPPGTNVDYEMAYTPLTMTQDSPHQGTLFFPLSDETALVFNLTGVTKQPKPTIRLLEKLRQRSHR